MLYTILSLLKTFKRLFLIFIIFFVIPNCKNYSEKKKEFQESINIIDNYNDIQAIVLIPDYLCTKCNSYIFRYVEEILKRGKKVDFIFYTKKEEVDKILSKIYHYSDRLFYIDHKNDLIVYPTILYLKNGKIKNIEYQNAKNPFAFEKLIKLR